MLLAYSIIITWLTAAYNTPQVELCTYAVPVGGGTTVSLSVRCDAATPIYTSAPSTIAAKSYTPVYFPAQSDCDAVGHAVMSQQPVDPNNAASGYQCIAH